MSKVIKLLLVTIGCSMGLLIAFFQFPNESKKTLNNLETEAKLLEKQIVKLTGETTQEESVEETPAAQESPAASQEYVSKAAQAAKQNSEIFHEMFVVVFGREPKDRGEFGSWVDTLNQGASLEGIYNGLIYSGQYKDLEANERGSTADALKIFGEELAILEAELPTPTQFVRVAATAHPTSMESGKPGFDELGPLKVNAELYSRYFVGSSIFTLKKILGEEALKVMASKNTFREKMSLWYSKWVVHMCQRNVDYGVPLRNKPDESLHYKWAIQNTDDRVQWEILNRLHRLMTEVNKVK